MKSDNEADKVKALDALGAWEKAAGSVKQIEALLGDKSPKVRAHAALALGHRPSGQGMRAGPGRTC